MSSTVDKMPDEFHRFRDAMMLKFGESMFDREIEGWAYALDAWQKYLSNSTQKEAALYLLLTILEGYAFKLYVRNGYEHSPKEINIAIQLLERLLREIPYKAPLQIEDQSSFEHLNAGRSYRQSAFLKKEFPLSIFEEMFLKELDHLDCIGRLLDVLSVLNNLYMYRFSYSLNVSDLNHAVASIEQALNLLEGMTSDTCILEEYDSHLWNIAHALEYRSKATGNKTDMDRSKDYHSKRESTGRVLERIYASE